MFIVYEATCFGPYRTETCSLIYNKHDVLDVNWFYYYSNITFNTSGCPQSTKEKMRLMTSYSQRIEIKISNHLTEFHESYNQ
jgi:hypothetical protein